MQQSEAAESTSSDGIAGARERLRGGGQPLEKNLRSEMESRFRHDFSQVRVHTGAAAGESARALHANAWTLGSDLVFAHGAYDTKSAKGQKLIAHELAHVVQQEHATRPEPQRELEVSAPGDATEREAEAAADTVMAGGSAGIREAADGDTVHRLSTGAAIGLGAGGAALGIGALVGIGYLVDWLVSDTDASKIEHPPDCGEKQNKKLKGVYETATKWLTQALAKLRGFNANPKAKGNDFVRERLAARFKSDAPETVATIERTVTQIHRLMTSGALKRECHGEEDSTCKGFAAAYVDRGAKTVVFCGAYFKPDHTNVNSIVHEYSHAVTGGADISDRGYASERVIKQLSTDEALNNAESYSEFIQELAEGTAVVNAVPQDTEECPQSTKPIVGTALARAERMNTNSENFFLDSTPKLQPTKVAYRNEFLPKPAAAAGASTPAAPAASGAGPAAPAAALQPAELEDIRYISDLLKKTAGQFGTSIDVSCAGGAAECPKGAGATFKPGDRKIFVCQGWLNQGDDNVRSTELLAAVYGALGGETRPDWQRGLAQMAAAITTRVFALPTHQEIVGSAGWTKDLLTMLLVLGARPKAAKSLYSETSTKHERLSTDVVEYKETSADGLPLEMRGIFFVDDGQNRRPGPFTPPLLTLEYIYSRDGAGKDAQNSGKVEDRDPVYGGQGKPLQTRLGHSVHVSLRGRGSFTLKLRMEDQDSGGLRLYEDAIRISQEDPASTPPLAPPVGGK
jgi:hypothetical protein